MKSFATILATFEAEFPEMFTDGGAVQEFRELRLAEALRAGMTMDSFEEMLADPSADVDAALDAAIGNARVSAQENTRPIDGGFLARGESLHSRGRTY